MSENMVERVATALGEADNWDRCDNAPDYRSHLPAWKDYAHLAIAAIKAMREPTEAMATAGVAAFTNVRDIWTAMIEAALTEKDKDDGR